MSSLIQKSQQLGLYNTACEARLALGKLQMEINPVAGRSQLTALASESRSHGLELLARQAEEAKAASTRVAASQPSK
jgi:hypothetical protein